MIQLNTNILLIGQIQAICLKKGIGKSLLESERAALLFPLRLILPAVLWIPPPPPVSLSWSLCHHICPLFLEASKLPSLLSVFYQHKSLHISPLNIIFKVPLWPHISFLFCLFSFFLLGLTHICPSLLSPLSLLLLRSLQCDFGSLPPM